MSKPTVADLTKRIEVLEASLHTVVTAIASMEGKFDAALAEAVASVKTEVAPPARTPVDPQSRLAAMQAARKAAMEGKATVKVVW